LIPASVAAASISASNRPASASATSVADPPIDDTVFVSPVVATAVTGSNGAGSQPSAAPRNHTRPGGTKPPPPRVHTRPGAGGPSVPRAAAGSVQKEGRRFPRALIVLLAGLIVVGVVVGAVLITSGGSSNNQVAAKQSSTTATASTRHRGRTVVAFNPRSIKLAVLNGTATAGLAARIAGKLDSHGYKVATTTNAASQTNTTTVVAYATGQRRAALAVAQSLGLQSAAVQPIDQSTQQIACPPPSSCANTVVVTAGSDLASST
jgi:hypothetical protein